jgi:hypothetical protein
MSGPHRARARAGRHECPCISSTIQLSKSFIFYHPTVFASGFADLAATWMQDHMSASSLSPLSLSFSQETRRTEAALAGASGHSDGRGVERETRGIDSPHRHELGVVRESTSSAAGGEQQQSQWRPRRSSSSPGWPCRWSRRRAPPEAQAGRAGWSAVPGTHARGQRPKMVSVTEETMARRPHLPPCCTRASTARIADRSRDSTTLSSSCLVALHSCVASS